MVFAATHEVIGSGPEFFGDEFGHEIGVVQDVPEASEAGGDVASVALSRDRL